MPITPEIALAVALIALFGVLVNALVAAANARKRGEIDEKLIQLKANLDKINATEMAKVQSQLSERLKQLEFDRSDQTANDDRRRKVDIETRDSIVDVLQPDGVIAFLRDHDFGGIFDRNEVTPLRRFVENSSRPDHEFLTPELEVLRASLMSQGRELLSLIGTTTYPRQGTLNSVQPTDLANVERGPQINDNAAKLNEVATNFVNSFDDLVRKSRSILGA